MYCPSLGRGLGITPFSSEVLDFRPVSTKIFFSCRMLIGRLYVRKTGLVEMGCLLTDQQTRLVPSRLADGSLWPTTPVSKDGRGITQLRRQGPYIVANCYAAIQVHYPATHF